MRQGVKKMSAFVSAYTWIVNKFLRSNTLMKILILYVQLVIYLLYVKMGMFYQYFVVMVITRVIALFLIFHYTYLIMTRKFKQWSTFFIKANNHLSLNTIDYDMYDIGNSGPTLKQAYKCGGFQSVMYLYSFTVHII